MIPLRISVAPGRRFGKLVVLHHSRRTIYLCRCDCGKEKFINAYKLTTKHDVSCGAKGCTVKNRRHGFTHTRVYQAWANMKDRCDNPSSCSYRLYGARGITVCERWQAFENFLADMGQPGKGQSLDRVDNLKGYSPANCRWATMKVQSNNKRNNVLLTFRGKTQTSAQWAVEAGLSRTCLYRRLKSGWSLERSLTTPLDESKNSRRLDDTSQN